MESDAGQERTAGRLAPDSANCHMEFIELRTRFPATRVSLLDARPPLHILLFDVVTVAHRDRLVWIHTNHQEAEGHLG